MKIRKPESSLEQFIEDHELTTVFDAQLLKNLQVHIFEPNEQIIEEGTEVKYLYLVIKGEAGVAPTSIEGKSGLLDYILPMDVVGDLEYFSQANYYHRVVALSQCHYLAIPVSLIPTHLNKNIDFYKFICVNMANKMQRTSKRYSRALFFPLKNSLAKYLYDLSIHQNTHVFKISTNDAAERFGVSSRHVRRTMAGLAEEGIVTRQHTTITIIDMDKLWHYANF